MPDGFTEYVERRATTMRSTAFLVCGDWHVAEDLVQTAFLKLFKVWDRARDMDELDAYTRQIVMRTFLDTRRRRWTAEVPSAELPERAVVGQPQVEDRLVMLAALETVPPRQRAVLVLRYWEDLSVEETARTLGVSPGTVKSQAADGLSRLRAAIGEPGHVRRS